VSLSSSKPSIRRNKSLHEQVYQALRTAILSGDLVSGTRLVETQLAEWLQVSRTPLREALRQLQQEGLVTADASGGLRVTTISATDASELYDCRLALEELAVAGACQHATEEQLAQLKSFVTAAERHQMAEPGSSPLRNSLDKDSLDKDLLDLDYRFHHLIAESSGNRRLVTLLEHLFNSMALLRIQTLKQNPNVLDIRLEHGQICDAILSRDATLAMAAIRYHLTASKARVVQEIEDSQRSSGAQP
jgi:DNA-binding GntR family transcriptional regulator